MIWLLLAVAANGDAYLAETLLAGSFVLGQFTSTASYSDVSYYGGSNWH